MSKAKVLVAGASGFAGALAAELVWRHPRLELIAATSRSEAGERLDRLYPRYRVPITLEELDLDRADQVDAAIVAYPHGAAAPVVAELRGLGAQVVDLSADFRLGDLPTYERWYGPHGAPELLEGAVYGLPEVNRESIKTARLVACPGCYPTAIQLGFLPLLENNLVDAEHLIASAASGVTGAGRQAKVDQLFAEVSDSFKAYAVDGHRHLPELEQGLRDIQQGQGNPALITFVPHLLPINRGIHASLYARLTRTDVDLQALFEQRFANEPFVDVLPAGVFPQTRFVKGTNVAVVPEDEMVGTLVEWADFIVEHGTDALQAWMQDGTRHLGQWPQHVGILGDLRPRQHDAGVQAKQIVIAQDVDIEGAGAEAAQITLAAIALFQRLQTCRQICQRLVGLQQHHQIEKVAAEAADRHALIYR